MNVLMISPVSLAWPRAGDGIRIAALAQGFASESRLTLVSPTKPEQLPPDLSALSEHWEMHVSRRSDLATVMRAISRRATYDQARYRYRFPTPDAPSPPFDVVYIHLPQGWTIWERHQSPIDARVVVADPQNDETDMWLQRSSAEDRWLVKQACLRFGRRAELRVRRMLAQADIVMCASERDRDTLASRIVRSTEPVFHIVPNGVDTLLFTPPAEEARNSHSVIFVGSLDTRMNQRAVKDLLDVWPAVLTRMPGASLTIAGRNPPPWLSSIRVPSVSVVASPSDVRPYLWSASAFVAPYFAGGGTKIKILEAMAARVPIVASHASVQGLPMTAGQHYLRIDRGSDIPAALEALMNDRNRSIALSNAAAERARQFDWRAIGADAVSSVRDYVAKRI